MESIAMSVLAFLIIVGSLYILFKVMKAVAFRDAKKLQQQWQEYAREEQPVPRPQRQSPVITVIGIGGGGSNAVDRLLDDGIDGVNFIVCNTRRDALSRSAAEHKIALGDEETFGRGTSGKPENGREAAEESFEELANSFTGSDMVVILTGMGGGTGTGASPVIAEIARDMGALTIAIVTTPFNFEGKRQQTAKKGLVQLRAAVDAITIIPNEQLTTVAPKSASMLEACRYADTVISQFIHGIRSYIAGDSDMERAFEDITLVLSNAGTMYIGAGEGAGQHRANEAAHAATSNPLVDHSLSGASQVLISIDGPTDLRDSEVDEIERIIAAATVMNNPITSTSVRRDDSMGDRIKVSVIATGFAEITYNPETGDEEDIELPNFLR